MSRLSRSRQRNSEEVDIDMVPIMNMFLVLIPFLLMSASFLHLKAINTSVPVLAESSENGSDAKSIIKVSVVVELERDGLHLSALSAELEEDMLNKWDIRIPKNDQGEYPLLQMVQVLAEIKLAYPKSDTVIVIPDGSIVYDTIIQTMDMARNSENTTLFPNVVISGKVT